MAKPYQDHDGGFDAGKAEPHPKRPNQRGRAILRGKFLCAAPVFKHLPDEMGVMRRKMVAPRIGAGGFNDGNDNGYTVGVTGAARRTYGFGHSKAERQDRRAERALKHRALLIRSHAEEVVK